MTWALWGGALGILVLISPGVRCRLQQWRVDRRAERARLRLVRDYIEERRGR